MNYEQFKILIENLEKIKDRTHNLYDYGVDLINYDEDYQRTIALLIKCVFDEQGEDWINWYLYERVSFDGKIHEAWDENKNPICYDIKSLWSVVKPYRKQ